MNVDPLHVDTGMHHRRPESRAESVSGDECPSTPGSLPPGVTAVNTKNGTILRKQRNSFLMPEKMIAIGIDEEEIMKLQKDHERNDDSMI